MRYINQTLSLFAFLLLSVTFIACQEDDEPIFVVTEADGIAFENDFSGEYLISEATATNVAERFVWNTPDFGAPVNVTYELQGSIDPEFSTFEVVGATTENNIAVTVDQLLGFAEELGLDADPATTTPDGLPNDAGQVFFRVFAATGAGGENAGTVTSDVEPLTIRMLEVTGEEPTASFMNLFMVGNASQDNWNNNGNNYPLFRSADNENQYSYTGYFNAGEFKLLETKGQWQPQWGTNDGSTLAVNDGTGDDPGAFTIDTEGYYTITLDLEAGTFDISAYDASAAATYTTIGYLGDATNPEDADDDGTPDGWQSDMDFIQSDFDPHIWYATGVTLADGEMKFRVDDAWDINWGGDTALSGTATLGGPNIPVEEGNYDIWFNDLTGEYILIPVE